MYGSVGLCEMLRFFLNSYRIGGLQGSLKLVNYCYYYANIVTLLIGFNCPVGYYKINIGLINQYYWTFTT
jgi:hypothetical protein